jgi:hypothetical protein
MELPMDESDMALSAIVTKVIVHNGKLASF